MPKFENKKICFSLFYSFKILRRKTNSEHEYLSNDIGTKCIEIDIRLLAAMQMGYMETTIHVGCVPLTQVIFNLRSTRGGNALSCGDSSPRSRELYTYMQQMYLFR